MPTFTYQMSLILLQQWWMSLTLELKLMELVRKNNTQECNVVNAEYWRAALWSAALRSGAPFLGAEPERNSRIFVGAEGGAELQYY